MNETVKTLMNQVGNQTFVMLGAKNLCYGENHIQFDFKGCRKYNHIQITYEVAFDTYTVQFHKNNFNKAQFDMLKEFRDVHCGEFSHLIESVTGLATKLF